MATALSNETKGNILHSSILAAGLLYAASVVYFTQSGRTGIFDESWRKDGFCIQNKDVPYWSSFDTCFYVDVLFSAILGCLYLSWRSRPGMEYCSEYVPMIIASTVGHGLAHEAMAYNFRSGATKGYTSGQMSDALFWQTLAFCVLFWLPLLKAALPKLSYSTVAILAAVVTYGPMLFGELPVEHRFAYVQTVVTVAFHVSQLMLNSKEKQRREYWSMPLIAALPPIVTAWNEALGCNAFFRRMGGHVLYDASIIIGFIVFYMDCYRHSLMKQAAAASKSNEKKTQ